MKNDIWESPLNHSTIINLKALKKQIKLQLNYSTRKCKADRWVQGQTCIILTKSSREARCNAAHAFHLKEDVLRQNLNT